MKESILIISLILTVIVFGCTNLQSNSKSKEVDLRIGVTGLTLEFLKNTPPAKIFEESVFPVIVKVRNNGAYSIKDNEAAVFSLGVEKDYTKKVSLLAAGSIQSLGIGNAALFKLEGKTKINPKGEEQVISYNVQAGKVDPQSEAHPSTVIATVCYPYESVLENSVCIDTDVVNLRPSKKVCQTQDIVFSNGQGAPVAVTKIEINMLPTLAEGQNELSGKIRPQFLIFVENKGQGIVIKKESVMDFCTKSETSHANLNIVYVDVYLAGQKLECQLEKKVGSDELGHIKLLDKKDIIRCVFKDGIEASRDTYLSPLKVVLKYGYTQSISANYFIQKTAR